MGYKIFIAAVIVASIWCAWAIVHEDRMIAFERRLWARIRLWARDRWIDRTAGRLAAEGLIVVRNVETLPLERDASCLQVIEAFYNTQK